MRAQAVALTAVALTLINVGLAALAARAAGVDVLGGLGLPLALVALGVLVAFAAVIAWRRYIQRLH